VGPKLMANNHDIVGAFSEIASHYENVVDGELRNFWGWSYEGFIDNLIRLTPLDDQDRVLDVATGTSVIPLKLTARQQYRGQITGLDITYAMLTQGKKKITASSANERISLVCANALAMPFRSSWYDVIVCGLATHHLDVGVLLDEMYRLLRPGGRLTIADVGGSAAWRQPLVGSLIRAATFLYFLPKEGAARAKVEAAALTNVLTPKEWETHLTQRHFKQVQVDLLPKSHTWAPAPLVMRAMKP
jgi:ubiquinone/menaquinone biosynthesis C-methylase UbiE